MKKLAQSLLFFVPVIGILAVMQFWAVTAREREWWWFDGGSDYLAFANLAQASERKGHILVVEKDPDDAPPQMEFGVRWSCNPAKISWGDVWTRDDDFNQIDRTSSPSNRNVLHSPDNLVEKRFLALACAQGRAVPQTIRLKAGTNPTDMTRRAFLLVSRGVPPAEALQRSAAD